MAVFRKTSRGKEYTAIKSEITQHMWTWYLQFSENCCLLKCTFQLLFFYILHVCIGM